MTNREWSLTVLLISISQGFIWYAAFVNAGNASALNYVSFAGTLISIILAVLAIGYTYGESVNQKGKGDTLAAQIMALTEVTRGIKIQAESLEEVSRIKVGLAGIAERIERGFTETGEKVSGMTESIDAVRQRVDSINVTRETPVKESKVNKAEASRSVLAARMPLMEIGILIIAVLAKRPGSGSVRSSEIAKTLSEYFDRTSAKTPIEPKEQLARYISLFSGTVHTMISVLQGLGLITITGDIITAMDENLSKEIAETVVKTPTSAGKFYTALRAELIADYTSPA